jgi:hypothetical protein
VAFVVPSWPNTKIVPAFAACAMPRTTIAAVAKARFLNVARMFDSPIQSGPFFGEPAPIRFCRPSRLQSLDQNPTAHPYVDKSSNINNLLIAEHG